MNQYYAGCTSYCGRNSIDTFYCYYENCNDPMYYFTYSPLPVTNSCKFMSSFIKLFEIFHRQNCNFLRAHFKHWYFG